MQVSIRLVICLASVIMGGCQTVDSKTRWKYPVNRTSVSPSCLPGELKSIIRSIEQKFGRVQIVSTYRKNARIRGRGQPSYHASCRAVDFNPARGTYNQVLAWLRDNHKGGLGTYSGSLHHIHIDNGPYIRFHHSTRRRK